MRSVRQAHRLFVVLLIAIGASMITLAAAPAFGINVQGIAPVGSPIAAIAPVLNGVSDGTNARAQAGDTNGNAFVSIRSGASSVLNANGLFVQGPAADAGATGGNPIWFAGSDNSGNVRHITTVPKGSAGGTPNVTVIGGTDAAGNVQAYAAETTTNAHHVTAGINAVLDTLTASGVKTSNGTTAVSIVSAVGGKRVFAGKILVYSVSTTVGHTVDIISSGGTVLLEFPLPKGADALSGGAFVLDDVGIVQSVLGEGLSFKIDAGGSGTDVKLTAMTVQK